MSTQTQKPVMLKAPKDVRELKNKELVDSLSNPLKFTCANAPSTTKFLSYFRESLQQYMCENLDLKWHQKFGIKFLGTRRKEIAAIMALHGLPYKHRNMLGEIVTNINKNTTNKTTSTEDSIDTNSNNSAVNIKSLFLDVDKIGHKTVGYWYLYKFLRQMYGQKEAKRLASLLYSYSLYFHDSTQILVPYCYCFDFSDMVLNGRQFGKVHTAPPRSARTYISLVSDTLPELSHHIAGAAALGSIFLDLAHILMYRERRSLKKLMEDADTQYYIKNLFQELIYTCNHNSRDAVQSPFSNISCFDYDKLMNLLAPDNYAHYFPKDDRVIQDNGLDTNISVDEYRKFAVKYIMKLQEEYVKVFGRGDPLANGRQFPFPVSTINLSIDMQNFIAKESELDEKGNPTNTLRDLACRNNLTYWNIFPSKGTKVASCCRLVSDKDMMDNAASVNSFGGTSISLGSFRVVTVNLMRVALETKSEEEFYALIRSRVRDTVKILAAHRELLKWTVKEGFQFFMKNGWIKLSRLFGTVGVLGYAEAAKYMEATYGGNKDYMKEMLIVLNDEVMAANNEKNENGGRKLPFVLNIEGIPAEQAAVTLSSADRVLFRNTVDYPIPELYQNQWSSLWEDLSMEERMARDGEIQNLLTGGSIVHINVNGKMNFEQAKNAINTAIKNNCGHFAFCETYIHCNDCGNDTSGDYKICPKCNSTNVEFQTRVIGYLSPVKLWNKVRKTVDFPNRKKIRL